jgi:hypothetical protein
MSVSARTFKGGLKETQNGYDPGTKQQLCRWKNPLSPCPRKVHSNVKSMLIVFFDIQGVVHCECSTRIICKPTLTLYSA